MTEQATLSTLRERLESAFAPTRLDIIDDSHKHIGHAGARHGGHFTVVVISDMFKDKSLLERHRMVYDAVGNLLQTGVHALSIKALTPQEAVPTQV